VRIYLNGSNTPTIEAPIEKLIGGDHLAGAPLSAEKARGRNLYLPLPYAKHCKVTVDNMPNQGNLYYQINYRKYAEGTVVKTFTMEEHKVALRGRTTRFTLEDVIDPLRYGRPNWEHARVIRSGESLTISSYEVTEANSWIISKFTALPMRLTKGREIDGIILKVIPQFDEKDVEGIAQTLRSTVLSITFDGKETVWCPLSDFFGSGVGINPYKSWYTWIEEDGTLFSRWKMPFKKSMEVKLINYGEEDIKVAGSAVIHTGYKWDDDRSMYFHADWRQERNIETIGGNGTKDWNYITLKGRGVFVGDVLSVLNRNHAWWGEGDEKIYVDGEGTPVSEGGKGILPSHFGTGTEDYYGYAWCTPEFFESPFHFQPRAEGPRNYGNVTNGRVRSLDAIPFTKDFRFDMEVWHWASTTIDYSVVNFWYGFDGTKLVDFQSREDQIAEVKAPVRYNTPMSLEVPGFKIVKAPTAGVIQNQGLRGFTRAGRTWDNDDHLWWTDARLGAKLELILATEKEGRYKLVAKLTKARDYGIIQFWVNGEKVGKPIDLYNSEVIPSGLIEVGAVDVKSGEQIVEVEIVGKNESAVPQYMVGIDLLKLIP
jgi:hypothetical protein